jgi:hypothetical protein
MPGSVREIAIASSFLDGRDFINPLGSGFEDGDDGLGLVARVKDFVVMNGLKESNNEAKEFFIGIRVMEVAEILWVLD